MRKFDFYEFAGILTPGATVIVGISVIFPSIGAFLKGAEFSVGDLGIFVLIAYVGGHLVQAVGNLIEYLWWKSRGGWPTDWPRSGKHFLISDEQIDGLNGRLSSLLGSDTTKRLKEMSHMAWFATTRQMYAAVQQAQHANRIDTFNGNYGLCRGIAAAFSALAILALVSHPVAWWKPILLLLVGAAVALYRMHRFGRYYAREIFVQYLQLTTSPHATKAAVRKTSTETESKS